MKYIPVGSLSGGGFPPELALFFCGVVFLILVAAFFFGEPLRWLLALLPPREKEKPKRRPGAPKGKRKR